MMMSLHARGRGQMSAADRTAHDDDRQAASAGDPAARALGLCSQCGWLSVKKRIILPKNLIQLLQGEDPSLFRTHIS